jgi:hypothetical protein
LKVIFLDIDGVLNNRDTLTNNYSYNCSPAAWSAESCDVLKEIVEKTGASVVISSTWRLTLMHMIEHGFKMIDIPMPIDKTCSLAGIYNENAPNEFIRESIRGDEIEQWLSLNPQVTHYVIIDDNSDMLPDQLANHFVQTDMYEGGLKREHIPRILEILS